MTQQADMTDTSTKPDHLADLVIRASAGTGKTFQLSNRYLSLLQLTSPDRILATTFTRKAAGEILERVLTRLAAAALDQKECENLAAFIHEPDLTPDDCRQMLRRLTHHLHRVRVSTLDSFFSQIATSFTLELGLPPGWRIIDEFEAVQLRERAIETVLQEGDRGDLTQLMHLLTRGEATRRVSDLIHDTVTNFEGVFADSDWKAWDWFPELHPLSEGELKATVAELEVISFPSHKTWQKQRDKDLALIRTGDWLTFIEKGIAAKVAAGEEKYCGKLITDDIELLYRRLLRHAKAIVLKQWRDQTQATWELLGRYASVVERTKREMRGLTFNDVTRTLARAADGSDAARFAFRIDAHVEHLLLDEFQDTSPVQWHVLRPFARAVVREPEGTFFCVGDIKQAIYGWRGGVAEIFDTIERELETLKVDSLTKSFRSSPPVIKAVNDIFERVPDHANLKKALDPIQLWCHEFEDHSTARSELPGHVIVEAAGIDEEDAELHREDVLAFAARRVVEIRRQLPGATIGVLTRTNPGVARTIFELRRLGVPASEEGGNPLTDSAALQLMMSLIRLADHPWDTVARFHVARSPLGQGLGFVDHSDTPAAVRLAEQVRLELLQSGYGESLYRWAGMIAPVCGKRDRSRLEQLVQLGFEYEAYSTLRPTDFADYVDTQRMDDPSRDTVRVMNIHQSKGLQFDVVLLPELEGRLQAVMPKFVTHFQNAGEPPDCVSLYRNEQLQQLAPPLVQEAFRDTHNRAIREAMCLLYVAMTRAVHALHVYLKPSSEKEKSLPATFAGLIRAGCGNSTPVEPETVLKEWGTADWYRQLPADSPILKAPAGDGSDPQAAVPKEPIRVKLAPMKDGRRRGRQRTAPSRKGEAAAVRLGDLLKPGRSFALERGTLIHAWFEQIEWLDDSEPDEATLRRQALKIDEAAQVDVDRALDEFRGMLQVPAIRECLSRGYYDSPGSLGLSDAATSELAAGPVRLTVENERDFALLEEDGALLTGSIDRLVLLEQDGKPIAADILDFKTDTIDEANPAKWNEMRAHYREQLTAYAAAVSQIYGLPDARIATRLILLSPGRVEMIER
ncbi:ATP-dependent helicase/nuclease subunit A [Maioricimonas rarisocia]|uniref:DNA 3'-5' helicase n=1 Tax=Maioricimonas rarisocia TaxID=2528026 RepID=A0A517Z8R2_9PLAN|nr:UvrD-helicase domain-containing protein [Maioricimonas rarisocia]QDU38877.1 ATP-dependent helicase/nuclease subunit A [Maioricimonas rarisocia]